MSTTTTSNMGLVLPVPTVELGPDWAIEIDTAFEVVDAHDHSSGKGVPITPAGLNINTDLDFQGVRAINLKSSQYDDQLSILVGATNAGSVYTVLGNLYYNNGSGVPVQITNGSSIVTAPASTDNFQFDGVNTSLTIAPADIFVFLDVDCSSARTITLPSASAVVPGRIYMVHDTTNQSEINNITVNPDGSDTINLAASDLINSNGATRGYISNGVSNWSVW